MKLVIGLGNIGKEYKKTRHNIGFDVVERYAEEKGVRFSENSKLECEMVKVNDLVLVKPTTYMNLSGNCFSKVVKYFKIDIKDVLVIYDDKDLDIGKLRLREKGSAGGQNGMKDIISHAKTDAVKRVRFGIGQPGRVPLSAFVLSKFGRSEKNEVNNGIDKVVKAIDDFANEVEFNKIMSDYNG